MLVTVLSCVLFIQGVFGNPLGELVWSETPIISHQPMPVARNYFDNVDGLNPFNWFSRKDPVEKNDYDKKLEELYKMIECLSSDNPKLCKQLLLQSRKRFTNSPIGPVSPEVVPEAVPAVAVPPPVAAAPAAIPPPAVPAEAAALPLESPIAPDLNPANPDEPPLTSNPAPAPADSP